MRKTGVGNSLKVLPVLKKLQENIGHDRLWLYSMFCYSREIYAKRCVVKFYLKYKKFWEEGDH